MRLFFSAGDISGDLHGGNLIRELRRRAPDLQVVGFGGPRMQEAGCQLLFPLTEMAVMWFLRVGLNLHRFADLIGQADRYLHRHRPDAVVLIDMPGFNWWMARRAHARGIRVFYYVPPQLWAWAPWRVRKMRRLVDHVLCSLPFEESWYQRRGVNAEYVGHPYFDELHQHPLDERFLRRYQPVSDPASPRVREPAAWRAHRLSESPIVGLLPGSRRQEVTANFPTMIRTAQRLHRALPGVRFLVACYKEEHRQICRQLIASTDLPIDLCVGKTAEIIHLAHAALAVSGSVGLELLYHLTPAVVLYRISLPALCIGRLFMQTRYISLVNVLADSELYPEFLTYRDDSPAISEHLLRWLTRPAEYRKIIDQLVDLKQKVAQPGASARAAEYILSQLTAPTTKMKLPTPHFAAVDIPKPATPDSSRWERR